MGNRADQEKVMKTIFAMCELFRDVAQFVGKKSGWEYNEKEGKAAYDFLEYVHQFSKKILKILS